MSEYNRGNRKGLGVSTFAWRHSGRNGPTNLPRNVPGYTVLGLGPLGLEHFGSTAVPGMMAKPVIDIMAVAESAQLAEEWIAGLRTLDYRNVGEWGNP